MDSYVLSKENILKANTYIPLRSKEGFITLVAANCFQKVELDNGLIELPPMYVEDSAKKSRYLMAALVRLYISSPVEHEEDDEWLMSYEEYDKWASGHVLNQIERFKSDAECKQICFDILHDYKDLEKKLNCELHSMIDIMNEPSYRILSGIAHSITPEVMQKALGELQNAANEIENYKSGIETEN